MENSLEIQFESLVMKCYGVGAFGARVTTELSAAKAATVNQITVNGRVFSVADDQVYTAPVVDDDPEQ